MIAWLMSAMSVTFPDAHTTHHAHHILYLGMNSTLFKYDYNSKTYLSSLPLFSYFSDSATVLSFTHNKTSTIVTGNFDTTSPLSQTDFCSVAKITPIAPSSSSSSSSSSSTVPPNFPPSLNSTSPDQIKLGTIGNLCQPGQNPLMSVSSSVLTSPTLLVVGGSFVTRVWSGSRHDFDKILYLAEYDAVEEVWAPLPGAESLTINDRGDPVDVKSLVYDSQTSTLYLGGAFDAGLKQYTHGRSVEPFVGGSLDGDVTEIVFDVVARTFYIIGSFSYCLEGIAEYHLDDDSWDCHTTFVTPSIIALSPYGLLAAGSTASQLFDVALFSIATKTWGKLPNFPSSHGTPILAMYQSENLTFFGGDGLLASWSPTTPYVNFHPPGIVEQITCNKPYTFLAPGAVETLSKTSVVIYCVFFGLLMGLLVSFSCDRKIWRAIVNSTPNHEIVSDGQGIPLNMLSYGALSTHTSDIVDSYYENAMSSRFVDPTNMQRINMITPREIILQKIIGEGSFGRVWSAKWRVTDVAVKEFVFAQAAVVGKSNQQQEIIEEIVGEAGLMTILRHPRITILHGCSLTSQAIWIVSELCNKGR